MTGIRNLVLTQGVQFLEQYGWTTGGEHQSLEGWTARAQVRDQPDGELLLDLTPHLTILTDVEVDGATRDVVQLLIPADVIRGVERGGRWDLYLVDADGGEQVRSVRLLEGRVRLKKAMTSND